MEGKGKGIQVEKGEGNIVSGNFLHPWTHGPLDPLMLVDPNDVAS